MSAQITRKPSVARLSAGRRQIALLVRMEWARNTGGASGRPPSLTPRPPAGPARRLRSNPGQSPSSRTGGSVDKTHLLEHLAGQAEAVQPRGHADIDRHLQEHLGKLGLGQPVVECATDVRLQLL